MEINTRLEQVGNGWVRWPELSEQPWEHKFNEYIDKLGKVSIEEYILIRRSFRAGWLSKEQST